MKRLIELREKRNRAVTQAREILKKAETESRDLNADEQSNYDKLMTEAVNRCPASMPNDT